LSKKLVEARGLGKPPHPGSLLFLGREGEKTERIHGLHKWVEIILSRIEIFPRIRPQMKGELWV
jgi:hypothetical protein